MMDQDRRESFRREVLSSFGAGDEIDELLAYNTNLFKQSPDAEDISFPLEDEPFAAAWQGYASEARSKPVVEVLKRPLLQLSFPIRDGISRKPAYRAVVLRGRPASECPLATGLPLTQPERIDLTMRATAAGRIGVIIVSDRGDFERIVRAVTMRNEPGSVPPSMGASMVTGFNNWDRIQAYRRAWSKARTAETDEKDWAVEFQRLIPRRELYQDRFIIVSRGPYSGVSAEALGLTTDEWTRISLEIRINHECTHYFTKRVLGSMRNNLLDEIIADYVGMAGALGRFRADWFKKFMGIDAYPDYSPGGRLENYRGDPPLSDAAFGILQSLVKAAAENLENAGRHLIPRRWSLQHEGRLILGLTRLTLEELASDEADTRLQAVLAPID